MTPANDNPNKERIVRAYTTQPVLGEVLAERIRQDEKWGEQNWPSFYDDAYELHPDLRAEYYRVPTEEIAKFATERRFKARRGTYADIFVEEVAEAIGALDEAHLREELVQVAAVAVAWIEAIDRRKAEERAA
jgi:acetyl-CoA acetyltransferase